jgi:hypothetical protein
MGSAFFFVARFLVGGGASSSSLSFSLAFFLVLLLGDTAPLCPPGLTLGVVTFVLPRLAGKAETPIRAHLARPTCLLAPPTRRMVDHPPVKSGRGEDIFLLLIAVVRNFAELAGFQELLRP